MGFKDPKAIVSSTLRPTPNLPLYSVGVVPELTIEHISMHVTKRKNKDDVRDASSLALVGATVASGGRGDIVSVGPGIPHKERDTRMHRQQNLDLQCS